MGLRGRTEKDLAGGWGGGGGLVSNRLLIRQNSDRGTMKST